MSVPAKQNVRKWSTEHADSFQPPVCNKIMYGEQLNVMFVGGPNSRKDFHLEEGEEVFFQIKGDMELPIMERGKFRTVRIREGELFILPSRIPHSPQRFKDTIGMVLERSRASHERDALKYYVEGTPITLWERWFHCMNLEKDLPPVINQVSESSDASDLHAATLNSQEILPSVIYTSDGGAWIVMQIPEILAFSNHCRFVQSEARKTGLPAQDSFDEGLEPIFEPDSERLVGNPFSLKEWLDQNRNVLNEFGCASLTNKDLHQTSIIVYSGKTHNVKGLKNADAFVWQLVGTTEISCLEKSMTLTELDCIVVPKGNDFTLNCGKESATMVVQMETPEEQT